MPEGLTGLPTTDATRPETSERDGSERPELSAAAEHQPAARGEILAPESDATVGEHNAIVPLHGTLRQDSRPSFWKRISMRRAGGSDTQLERVLAGIAGVEASVAASDLALSNRIKQLDDRFTEVWEVEEQLSQLSDLRATLDEIAARQLRLGEQLGAISGRLTLVSALAVAAIGAGLASIFLP